MLKVLTEIFVLGSSIEADLKNVANNFEKVETTLIDVEKPGPDLQSMIEKSDIVVSLLPHFLHPKIAELCIESQVNMVTASYCTDELMKLHER